MLEPNSNIEITEMGKKSKGPSETAERVALYRTMESGKPGGERICYDPYAIRFVSRETLEFSARHPVEARAAGKRNEHFDPGIINSIVARVRYFDDVVASSINDGLEQLVIFGAGYDTRAYRIDGLNMVRVFEVDHPATQRMKIEKIKEIFGSLPDHVVYVPVDFAAQALGQRLMESGYDRCRKTIFIAEGLFMYLPLLAVDGMLSFVVNNSGKGSAIVFDYIPQSVADGTYEAESAKNLRKRVAGAGEPFLFGIKEGTAEDFLARRGFAKIKNVTSEDYKKAYFHGKNEGRELSEFISFAYAVVE